MSLVISGDTYRGAAHVDYHPRRLTRLTYVELLNDSARKAVADQSSHLYLSATAPFLTIILSVADNSMKIKDKYKKNQLRVWTLMGVA
ncbi:MAG: hypothetical protein OEU36_05710 [Gammaproteobacteria bacterium]|nr:hypothetical protein [Gammaproteobacteria bacterium]